LGGYPKLLFSDAGIIRATGVPAGPMAFRRRKQHRKALILSNSPATNGKATSNRIAGGAPELSQQKQSGD